MVSIAANYVYTFTAITAVSTLLIFSFIAYASTLQTIPETYNIKNLAEHVASKIIDALTLVDSTNSAMEMRLEMPSAINNREYWLRLRNDSRSSWVEAGFGTLHNSSSDLRVYLPHEACYSGYYVSGYGVAIIKCWKDGVAPHLMLSCSGGEKT